MSNEFMPEDEKVGDVEIKTISAMGIMGLVVIASYTLYEMAHYHDHND